MFSVSKLSDIFFKSVSNDATLQEIIRHQYEQGKMVAFDSPLVFGIDIYNGYCAGRATIKRESKELFKIVAEDKLFFLFGYRLYQG